MNKGKLYIGTIGHSTSRIVLDELLELSEAIETTEPAEDDIGGLVWKKEPIEITVEAKIDKFALLYILTGVKVTNNWLKLHGGIMRRKRWINDTYKHNNC